MKLLYVVLALVIIGSATATTVYSADYQIPSWTKNVALFWGQGEIEDGEYVEFLQFLVDEEIITIPYDNSEEISQLENKVASLESEISSLKSSIATDLKNAYDDGYAAGIKSAKSPTLEEAIESVTAGPETHIVETAMGSGAPGCETSNACYLPQDITINAGDTVTWNNVDNAAHTVTSGSPANGPSGVFDSSLLMAQGVFSHTFDDAGYYDYLCLVHPWMIGSVTVN